RRAPWRRLRGVNIHRQRRYSTRHDDHVRVLALAPRHPRHRSLPRHRRSLVRRAPRRPGRGDESRTWPPHKDGEAAAYLLFNRNKRGIALDLKTPESVEVVKRLVKTADVGIENFPTGTMGSFGLGYDVLSQINPRLIYCSVSAFGRTGPRKDSPGYEALMQAFSGIMSITGEPGGQ